MKNSYRAAFTVVELVIVIAVIATLVTVTVVGWGGWRSNVAKTEVKSDLEQAASAMENAKNFGSGYPGSIPNTFTAGSNVTLTYVSGNSAGYCIQAQSKNVASVAFHINTSVSKTPQAGLCSGSAPSTPMPSIASATSSSLTISWPNVNGAASYSVRYSTTSPPASVAGCSSSPCTISGLTIGTRYYVTVTATNASGSTVSSIIEGWTLLQPPSTPSITLVWTGGMTKTGTATASGGTCSQGTTEWKITISHSGPNWNNATNWQTSNTHQITVPSNAFIPPSEYDAYAMVRCNNGFTSTEYNGYASSNSS